MDVRSIIEKLNLAPHVEGGYFRRTFESKHQCESRSAMTSIYYLLTQDSPIGYWHKNRSDIILFFHTGSPLTYRIVSPEGRFEKRVLGNDLTQGHEFQICVPGECWKCTELQSGAYSLLSEAVAPGFEYRDMILATRQDIEPYLHLTQESLLPFVKPDQ